MDRCVLDSSVIIKSVFQPMKSLPDKFYKREMETHQKCRFVIEKIEESDLDIYIPRVCVVETAAVFLKAFSIRMKSLMRLFCLILPGRLPWTQDALDLIHILSHQP